MGLNFNELDEQWNQRHDTAVLAAYETQLDRALYGSTAEPAYGLLWRWARLSHFRALLQGDGGHITAARRHYAAGAQEALKAVALQPNRVEGQYWCGLNLIEEGSLYGRLAATRVLFTAAPHIDRAAALDETYDSAGPLREQARIAHHKPLFFGGDLDRALLIYQRALQIAPDNSTTLLRYAECLLANQQGAEARRALCQIIEAPPDPERVCEQARDRRRAVALAGS